MVTEKTATKEKIRINETKERKEKKEREKKEIL